MQWPFRAFPMLAQRPGCVKGAGGILPFGANDVHFAYASSQISWRIFPAFGQGGRHPQDTLLRLGPGGARLRGATTGQCLPAQGGGATRQRRPFCRAVPVRALHPGHAHDHAGRPRPGGPSGRARPSRPLRLRMRRNWTTSCCGIWTRRAGPNRWKSLCGRVSARLCCA